MAEFDSTKPADSLIQTRVSELFSGRITDRKLDGNNYLQWKRVVEIYVASRGKTSHLSADPPTPTTDSWTLDDNVLLHQILTSMVPKIQDLVLHCLTVKELWAFLADLYGGRSDVNRAYDVIQELFRKKQDGKHMDDHYGEFNRLAEELRQIFPITGDIKQMQNQWNRLMVLTYLGTLDPAYSSARPQIMGSSAVSSLAETYHFLKNVISAPPPAHSTDSQDHSALATQQWQSTGRGGYSGGRGRGGSDGRGGFNGGGRSTGRGGQRGGRGGPSRGGSGDDSVIHCHYCHEPGHMKYNCPKRKGKEAYLASHDISQDNPSQHPSTFPDEQLRRQFEEFQLFQQYQHTQSGPSSSSATLAQAGTSTAFLTSSSAPTWIIDSGATDHMTGNRGIMSSFSSTSNSVVLADGSRKPIRGSGSVLTSPSLPLSSVFYLPDFPYNLLSVSKITKLLNCSVTFFPSYCIFQDLVTRKTIGTGRESNGLYAMELASDQVACISTVSALESHCRLGHPSLPVLKLLVPSLGSLSSLDCESCQLGKHHRVSYPSRVNNRVGQLFDLVHSDVWGPCPIVSKLGFKYFVSFVDDYSRVTWIYLLKSRSDVFPTFKIFLSEIQNQFKTNIKILRSDNAKEYLDTKFSNFLAQSGILHQSSCIYTPQQNGVAERKNRHLLDVARTLLFHRQVPKEFWGDAILTACYLINRIPSSVLQNKIPYTLMYPNTPLFHLPPKKFGSMCFVHNFSPHKNKLDPRSHKGIFLGYSRTQKGYRCFIPSLRRYVLSADVTFFEHQSGHCSSVPPVPSDSYDYLTLRETVFQQVDSLADNSTGTDPQRLRGPLQVYTRRHAPAPVPLSTSTSGPASSTTVPLSENSDDRLIALRKGKRTCTLHPLSNFVSYSHLSSSFKSFISSLDSYSVPKTVSEALSMPGWVQAMKDEMAALEHNETWDLVSIPPGKKVVGCKWVYTVKLNPDGTLARLKARLVAKGFSQVYGLDYLDTFSPVAKMTSVRLLISLATTHHWPLHQLDIKNAFLNGILDEEVYMAQPPGFVAHGESMKVCKLKKTIYGLKQSPRAWFCRFASTVQDFGLHRSEKDHSVFWRLHNGKRILLVVYVDDIVITGDDTIGIVSLKKHLHERFQTKDLGSLKYFLGIEVAKSKKGVHLSQRKYVLDMLSEAGMLGCRSIDSPMDVNVKLLPDQGELLEDVGRYRRLVGKLNYLTITRPDITFAVSVVSQFLSAPRTGHMDAVLRILRYLKKTPGKGLLYSDQGHARVAGFSDADWAGCPIDRRSTTGYCVFFGGNLVSWKSKKQSVVSRSSAESEYRAMANVTLEMIWIKDLLTEVGLSPEGPMNLYGDNQAAIHIAENPVFHERTKHIEVDCHIVRRKIVDKIINTRHVSTGHQLADILTKPLGKTRVDFICDKLGMYDIYAPA